MAIYMETTKIGVPQTIAQITKLLVKTGARQIATEYDDDGPCGLTFTIPFESRTFCYKLPVRTKAVFNILQARRSFPWKGEAQDHAQSKRTGWRQILRWLEAQFALMDSGMTEIKEVFLPYYYDGEQTFYEWFAEKEGIKLLEE